MYVNGPSAATGLSATAATAGALSGNWVWVVVALLAFVAIIGARMIYQARRRRVLAGNSNYTGQRNIDRQ